MDLFSWGGKGRDKDEKEKASEKEKEKDKNKNMTSKAQSSSQFEVAEMPVSDHMIWICEKCGLKLSGNEDGSGGSKYDNPSRKLQKAVKGIVSENKRKREVRTLVSSCMNVCPPGQIAAGIVDLKAGKTRFITFDLKDDIDALAQDLYRQI